MNRILIPGTLEALRDEVAAAFASRGHETLFMGTLEDADIICGQSYVDNDVCIAGIGAIGQTIRYLQEHDGEFDVLACELCKDCRALSMAALVPDALRRAGVRYGEVVEFSCAELASAAGMRSEAAPAGRQVIGITGNTAMLAAPLFTHTVAERIQMSGCEVLMPPLGLVVNEQDFLEPTLEWFAEQGVRTVICVLAFGCLGGHAYARGRARQLRERFPQIDLTLLDYDRDASDINLINRTELVIQSALS